MSPPIAAAASTTAFTNDIKILTDCLYLCVNQTSQITAIFTNTDNKLLILSLAASNNLKFSPISPVVILVLVLVGELVRTSFIAKQAEIRKYRKTSLQDTQQSVQVFDVTFQRQGTNHLQKQLCASINAICLGCDATRIYITIYAIHCLTGQSW